MTEPVELILSVSTINDWIRCGHAWYLKNVLRLPAAPNLDMAVGTAVHAGVETMHKGGLGPRLATRIALENELASMPGHDASEAAKGLTDALAMFRLYREKLPNFHPTIVERDFLVRIDGQLVSGRIDAADDDVHDTKTTALLSRFRPERHRPQMSLYRHGFRAITGRWPSRLLLDIVARNLKFKQVEVEPDDQELADIVGLTSSSILRGEFSPTGALSGQCPRCPYSGGQCAYAKLD